MEKKRAWWRNPWVPVIIVVVALSLMGNAVYALVNTQKVPAQPINFPHRLHIALGANCQYCHAGVAWGPSAGLPSTNKCWGCHQQIQKQSPELDKLAAFAKAGAEIPWVPVAIQPDFVHFNHRPHIAAGVECKACHGDLSKMTVAEPQKGQNMGWCLSCHQKMRPEKFTHLSDCSLCHY